MTKDRRHSAPRSRNGLRVVPKHAIGAEPMPAGAGTGPLSCGATVPLFPDFGPARMLEVCRAA